MTKLSVCGRYTFSALHLFTIHLSCSLILKGKQTTLSSACIFLLFQTRGKRRGGNRGTRRPPAHDIKSHPHAGGLIIDVSTQIQCAFSALQGIQSERICSFPPKNKTKCKVDEILIGSGLIYCELCLDLFKHLNQSLTSTVFMAGLHPVHSVSTDSKLALSHWCLEQCVSV